MECVLCHPKSGLGLVEVVRTFIGRQVPGLIKGLHDGRLQGLSLSSHQVLF